MKATFRTLLAAAAIFAALHDCHAAERWKGDGISWVAPEGWSQMDGGGAFRVATLFTGDGAARAEIAVSRLRGDGGGVLANVNRWRAQVGLPPIDGEQLKRESRIVKAGEHEAMIVDLKGESKRMIATILPTGETTWFFKLLATPDLAEKHKDAMPRLIESVRVAE